MSAVDERAVSDLTLDETGWSGDGAPHRNLAPSRLVEQAILRGEGMLADSGALVFLTGQYTGRSPEDKFIVREPGVEAEVDWGKVNRPFDPAQFDALADRVRDHLRGREVWVQDAFAGTDPQPPAADPGRLRAGVSRAVRPPTVRPRLGRGAGEPPAGVHHRRRARVQGGAGAGRDAERGVHPPGLRPPARPDRRHALRGRDQEVGLLDPEHALAPRGRVADALLGERRRVGRRRALLRPLGDRQDHALGRPLARPDRRRRARLER